MGFVFQESKQEITKLFPFVLMVEKHEGESFTLKLLYYGQRFYKGTIQYGIKVLFRFGNVRVFSKSAVIPILELIANYTGGHTSFKQC